MILAYAETCVDCHCHGELWSRGTLNLFAGHLQYLDVLCAYVYLVLRSRCGTYDLICTDSYPPVCSLVLIIIPYFCCRTIITIALRQGLYAGHGFGGGGSMPMLFLDVPLSTQCTLVQLIVLT